MAGLQRVKSGTCEQQILSTATSRHTGWLATRDESSERSEISYWIILSTSLPLTDFIFASLNCRTVAGHGSRVHLWPVMMFMWLKPSNLQIACRSSVSRTRACCDTWFGKIQEPITLLARQ